MQKSNLESLLFRGNHQLYVIIDAARIEGLTTELLVQRPEHRILFEGSDAIELEEVAPYLVRLHKKDPFAQWVFDDVYGNNGAIFVHSNYDTESLASHFGAYLYVSREVEHPDTHETVIQEGVLAYYDPRVLPEWLESIEEIKKLDFLAPTTYIWYEDVVDKSKLYAYTTNGIKETYHIAKESPCI